MERELELYQEEFDRVVLYHLSVLNEIDIIKDGKLLLDEESRTRMTNLYNMSHKLHTDMITLNSKIKELKRNLRVKA